MATPAYIGTFFRIIIQIVVARHFDRQSFVHVAAIFSIERKGRIFGMTGHAEFTSVARRHPVDSRLWGVGE